MSDENGNRVPGGNALHEPGIHARSRSLYLRNHSPTIPLPLSLLSAFPTFSAQAAGLSFRICRKQTGRRIVADERMQWCRWPRAEPRHRRAAWVAT